MNSQHLKTQLKTFVPAALLASTLAASSVAVAAQHTTKEPAAKKGTAAAAVLLVVPTAYANDEKLGNGCWARLYDGGNFTGSQYVLVGPVDVAAMRDGIGLNEKYDSVVVGPKATLTVYDNVNYRDKSATLKPASRTADLDEKMGLFETIRSRKVSCAS